jgi:endonuclease YncB( thermonuclease family)
MRRRIVLALFPVAAEAGWLFFIGGAVAETKGPWEVKGRQVRYHTVGGRFFSISTQDVDLAASAFLTSQVASAAAGDVRSEASVVEWARRLRAERAALDAAAGSPRAAAPNPAPAEPGCIPARAIAAKSSGSVELAIAGRVETTHLACLDAPEPNRGLEPFLPLAGESVAYAQELIGAGVELCLVHGQGEPTVDREGHRIGYLRFADGRDFGTEMIRHGYAISSSRACVRRDEYRALELDAAAQRRGLWAASNTSDVIGALVAVLPGARGTGAPPPRAPETLGSSSS